MASTTTTRRKVGTPSPSSKSGKRFDELYRLKGVLGTGAFSTVREGYHRSNRDVSYAVKCVNRKKLTEEDEAALLDEVDILKEMKNDHIIRLYDFFTEPSTYYLVMEQMSGGELFDRIVAKAYYNEKEARDTCKILLEAVGYMHQNHVAHRDLKPENLLLVSKDDDSAVKIADFGFAKKVYEHNSLTTQCGTPGYVAPEILEGTPYDERADMWSVGVILYILLGGYPPFIENTQRDLFRKIRRGEYEFHEEYWGTVSTEAKELISSLLTVKASKRLDAVQALENPWIQGDDASLAKKGLDKNLKEFKKFNAKRKFKAAVSTIMAVNKLNSLGKEFLSGM
ncbi:serine/threonine protein kinase [Nitzschia inconspicua]|uniref:Serine/threonine protein kinase n=1 Tax=Nitzschia inconspicua TaxID=303405 RepID=A0A9K3LKS2_9STRA|nr:serine/threonine protein kinase [Nitzschia inconspicua]